MLRAFRVTTSADGCTPTTVQAFYNDEHALTLGIRQIQVKKACSGGTGIFTTDYPFSPMASPGPTAQSVINPNVGSEIQVPPPNDQAGTDTADRPMFPVIFITDVTYGGNPLAGDWQFGGTGIKPSFVSGTWKGAVRTVDQTTNTVTVTPDADPPENNWNLGPGADPVPPGLINQGYGAEIRWDIADLGLQPGHSYRLYFIVHDGDQNKVGGDCGQGCAFITMPGPPPASPTPTATASPTPTPTATPTATPAGVVVGGKLLGPSGATKTVVITFQNNTATSQVLDALGNPNPTFPMTWPQATNGNLRSIKMGATTIFNTSTANPPGLNTSSLLGTAAQRTIAAGACATLTFTFSNNVDKDSTHYMGSAHFNSFGNVPMFP